MNSLNKRKLMYYGVRRINWFVTLYFKDAQENSCLHKFTAECSLTRSVSTVLTATDKSQFIVVTVSNKWEFGNRITMF